MLSVTRLTARRGVWLLLALVLMADLQVTEAAGSRYDRTIRALQVAEAEWRSDFAGIALWQLAGAYYAEADLARQDMQRRDLNTAAGSAQQKQRHWSSSVEQYASQLTRFQRRVEEGGAVLFDLSPVTEAVLQVDGIQVMLAHPRPQQQAVFEQKILEQFCQLRDCAALTGLMDVAAKRSWSATEEDAITAVEPASAGTSQPSAAQRAVKPGWEFTANGSVCTYGGLRLRFVPGANPGAVRNLCLDLFAEIAVLLEGLRQQQQYGVRMDWSALAFSQSMLQLNRDSDLLRLQAPLLQANPALLRSLTPWLAAQLSGEQTMLELQADTFGWHGAALDRYR